MQSAQANLLVYEPFAYTVGAGIAGKAGSSGFTGSWIEMPSTPAEADTIANGSLSYGSLQTSGNSLLSTSVTGNGSALSRSFTTIPGTAGTTTWASFELSVTSTPTVGNSAYFTVSPGVGVAPRFGVFDNGSSMVFGIDSNQVGSPVLSSVPFQAGQTYLLVAKIEWVGSGSPEMISLYVNPALNGSSLIAAATRNDLDIATGSGTNRLTGLGMGTVGDGINWTYDELRVGQTFADVVPVPEPSTITLGLAALILMLVRVCWRKDRASVGQNSTKPLTPA